MPKIPENNKGGRPLKFKTLKALTTKINKYWKGFEEGGETEHEVPDIEGLCVFLDICRDTLCEYEKKEEFSDTIKRTKTKIFHHKKQGALKGKYNAAVFIFDAKNNHGYRDKTEVDQNLKGSMNISTRAFTFVPAENQIENKTDENTDTYLK